MRFVVFTFLVCILQMRLACSISWNMGSKDARVATNSQGSRLDWSQAQSSLRDVYATALDELQELELAPLCHRNAARLLVNNCQLLDGRDEASVHTDSGQASRDFVDSYAASLAICDLERGSFKIPSACVRFQEYTLARLSIPTQPQLHVSTTEIDMCLHGLAQSDSAWVTWVSYRHKALRFCDAARADNLKDRDIRLYQQLTDIMARLTTEVESHLEERLRALHDAFENTNSALESLEPRFQALRSNIEDVEDMVSTRLFKLTQDHQDRLNRGLIDVTMLQEMISMMVTTMAQNTDQMIETQENALAVVNQKVNSENQLVLTALAATMATAISLQDELEKSKVKAVEVGHQQNQVESALTQVESRAKAVAMAIEEHDKKIEASNILADKLVTVLDAAATSAESFQSSMVSRMGLSGWWPFLYCPTVSLLLGSYGLPPSFLRNIGLFGLGEAVAFLLSAVGEPSTTLPDSEATTDLSTTTGDDERETGDAEIPTDSDAQVDDLRKNRFARTF